MADTRMVCKVCKKEFSGGIPAQQHYESKTHQKAVRNRELIESSQLSPQFKCDICESIMNSNEAYRKHMSSPKHLEKAKRAKTIESYGCISTVQIPQHEGKEYAFNGERGFCYICNIELTSRAVADQHINGEKHAKKKAAMTYNHVSSLARDTCNACGQRFSSQQEADAHFAGKSHREKMASLGHHSNSMDTTEGNPTLSTAMETSNYPTENLACLPTGAEVKRPGYGKEIPCRAPTKPTTVDGVYEFDGKTGHCHICNVALTSEENANAHLKGTRHRKALVKSGVEKVRDLKVSDSQEYYFNGDRGKCLVCDIEFTSERHAQDHLSGTKHTKAVQRQAESQHTTDTQEYEMSGTRGYCNVCQIELSSSQHATEHIAGKPHAKARAAWEGRKQTQSQGIPSPPSAMGDRLQEVQPVSPGRPDVSPWYISAERQRSDVSESSSTLKDIIEIKASENINQHDQIPNSSGSEVFDGRNIAASDSQDYWFNGHAGHCNLCSIDLTSRAHAMQHISGKNHKKAKQRNENISSVDDNLYCKICKVPFSGQESAKQHYASEKHIKREHIKGTHSTVESSVSAPGQKAMDNTNWYPCFVCGCYLNSKEQLEIHEQSVSHRAATEGLNSLGFQETLVMTSDDSREERIVRVTKNSLGTGQTPEMFNTSRSPSDTVVSGMKFEPISLDQLGNLDPASLSCTTNGVGEYDETLTKSVYHSEQPDQLSTSKMNSNLCSGIPKEKEINKPSIMSQISKNSDSSAVGLSRSASRSASRSPSVGPDSQKHAGSQRDGTIVYHDMSSESGHSSSLSGHSSNLSGQSSLGSDRDNRMPSLEPIDDLPELVSICTSMSELKIKKDICNTEKKCVDVNDFRRKKEGREKQKIEITTSGHVPVPRKAIDISDMDSLDSTSSSEHTSGGQTRRGEGTDSARAVRNRTGRRKTSHDRSVSLESESDPDKDADSSVESCQSAGLSKNHTKLMSLISKKLKDVPQRSTPPNLTETEKSVSKNYRHYCSTCKVPMDTEKAFNDHLRGKLHRQKSAKEPATNREHPALIKTMRIQDEHRGQTGFTETVPRSYQWELFRKVLAGDRICFLPTGTGKTLIGCMAIGAMLELNPTYQVLFLVTKVLLVLQQAKYIKRQLGSRKFRRFDPDDPSKQIVRELKIAELCGGQQSTGGVPLWQHDIIVATAAFCENMLTDVVLRWEDQCLVVFDEAHHCNKNHSYNNLMATYHFQRPEPSRCKVLGLTASPAGKNNYSMTVDMLRQLQINLGDSHIAVVEDEKAELQAFMSNAKIHIAVMETTAIEEEFQRDLRVYLLQCYMRLAAETNITEHSNLGLTGVSRSLGTDDLQRHAQDLTGNVMDELQALIAMAKPNTAGVDKRIEVQNLIGHIQCICMAISVAAEVGTSEALEELQILMATNLNQDFEFAKQISLPCENILRSIETQQRILKSNLKSLNESVNQEMSSSVKCLMQQLMNQNYIQWNDGHRGQPLALVLVKQRATATKLHTVLRNHPEIVHRSLSVEKIVGHGAAAAEPGMSVAQQRKVLEEIKDHKHQIVIATAVAEEGIDLPECELVVSMNPPSTMTALVQMRGRARKRDSHFVIVCNDSKEEAKLSDLLAREQNMIKAANFLVHSQKRQQAMEVGNQKL